MTQKVRERFAGEITYFKAGHTARPPAWPVLREMCAEVGINTFTGTTSDDGGFWDPYFALGYPQWPTLEGWFDHLRAQGKAVAFTFDAFHAWADRTAGFESSTWKEYIAGIGRSLRNVGADMRCNTLRDAHDFMWRIHEFPTRMRHDDIYIGTQDGNLAVDAQGRFVLVYAPGRPDDETARFDIDACDSDIGLEEDLGPTATKEA